MWARPCMMYAHGFVGFVPRVFENWRNDWPDGGIRVQAEATRREDGSLSDEVCVCARMKIGFRSLGATVHRQIDTNSVENSPNTIATSRSIMLVSNCPHEAAGRHSAVFVTSILPGTKQNKVLSSNLKNSTSPL